MVAAARRASPAGSKRASERLQGRNQDRNPQLK